jgi:hypothetical protein
MSSTLSLRDAERRINYSIQETTILTDVITEVEANIVASDTVYTLTREVANLLQETHERLCDLFAAINATRLQSGVSEPAEHLIH